MSCFSFSVSIDCGLVAHRTCTATGLPSNCLPVDSENRAHRFTPGKWHKKLSRYKTPRGGVQFRNMTLIRLGRNTPITSSLR